MLYRRVGNSGLKLPAISLGFWHNFGAKESLESSKEKTLYAFDHGICHFDLANNYGPPPGSAESVFGEILKKDLLPFRDEITIDRKSTRLNSSHVRISYAVFCLKKKKKKKK